VFNILLIVPRTYSYTMHAAAGETTQSQTIFTSQPGPGFYTSYHSGLWSSCYSLFVISKSSL